MATATRHGSQAKKRVLVAAERLLMLYGVQGVTTLDVTAGLS